MPPRHAHQEDDDSGEHWLFRQPNIPRADHLRRDDRAARMTRPMPPPGLPPEDPRWTEVSPAGQPRIRYPLPGANPLGVATVDHPRPPRPTPQPPAETPPATVRLMDAIRDRYLPALGFALLIAALLAAGAVVAVDHHRMGDMQRRIERLEQPVPSTTSGN